MPDTWDLYTYPPTQWHTSDFLYAVRQATGGSIQNIFTAERGFKSYGYTSAYAAVHNITTARTNILANRPVFMSGYLSSGGAGHAWVCDGLRDDRYDTQFFVDFFHNGSYGYYWYGTPASPYVSSSSYTYFYHMNWGDAGNRDGFYINHGFPSLYQGYQTSRQDIYNIY